MLIKIDKDRYINSDHIVLIAPYSQQSDSATIYLSTGMPIEVSTSIVAYIAQTLDASDAFTEEKPTALSLASRLAHFLRNQAAGQTTTNLLTQFPNEPVEAVIIELCNSNTIRKLGDTFDPLYYHASNPIFTGNTEQF